jgi:hypothetical protein
MSNKNNIREIIKNLDPIDSYSKDELAEILKGIQRAYTRLGLSTDIESESTPLPKLDLDKTYNFNPNLNSKGYPNNDEYMHIPRQHDVNKWMEAVKTIYYLERNNSGRIDSIRKVTSSWTPTETFDFLNWLKFYESKSHMKYKFAQLWYENTEQPGYFLHIKPDPKKEEEKNIDFSRDTNTLDTGSSEKKNIIEKQRYKIIGRLDSAEKLMRSNEGQMFAGKEFETLLEAIYELKKKIQMVNKISSSTKLYEDMIVREANILNRGGFFKAAELLYSVAQANNPPPPGTGKPDAQPMPAPVPPPPAPPMQPSGAPGGLPSTGPGSPSNQSDAPNENAGLNEFLNNLSTAKITNLDKAKADDLEISDGDDLLVVEAQVAPPATPDMPLPLPEKSPVMKQPTNKAPQLEVTEKDITPSPEISKDTKTVSDFDNRVNQVFANITILDVITKLEDLAKVFKTREIPRQLGIVDMMLDSLGLASYFPSLSEATNKSLESNNYISTRVEDIISKLRGAIGTHDIDLKGDAEEKPEIAGIKNKLKSDDDKEKARKQMRKDQEISDMESHDKETPKIDIEEDLGAKPEAPPAPPAPPPPPAR